MNNPPIEVFYDKNAVFWGCLDMVYQATYGGFDLDCKVGYGKTEEEAIQDLKDACE